MLSRWGLSPPPVRAHPSQAEVAAINDQVQLLLGWLADERHPSFGGRNPVLGTPWPRRPWTM